MKILLKILLFLAIDFILLWLWVYQMDPDPSVSIALILLIPFVFCVNLIIAGIFFFMKKKTYAYLFLANAFVASFLLDYLYGEGIARYQNRRLESWEFVKNDTTFSVIRWKEFNEFSFSYSEDEGSSTNFLDGKCEAKNGEWILTTDSTMMKIKDNTLIGFRNPTDTIQMKKIER